MSTERAGTDVIDVYADTVPGRRQRTRDYRPLPLGVPRPVHDFRTPDLATPVIERPSSWPETTIGAEEIMRRAGALEAGVSGWERKRRLVALGSLLDWLATFPGQTWQQRWLQEPTRPERPGPTRWPCPACSAALTAPPSCEGRRGA